MAFGPNSNDIEINVKVEQSGAIQSFDNLGKKIGEVDAATEKTSEGLSKTQANILTLESAVNLSVAAFSALSGGLALTLAAIERGSAVGDLSDAFNNLTQQAGGTADLLLGELKTAADNTISSFDLMKQANESLRAGLKPDEIIKVTQAARALAEETGGSLTEEIEGLTKALITGNDKFLKTRGIYLDTNTALDKYAASIGTTKDALTELQKIEATRVAALEALNGKAKEGAAVQTDSADAIAQVRAAIQDTVDETAKYIASNETLIALIADFARGLRSIDFKGYIDDVASATEYTIDLASAVKSFTSGETLGEAFEQIGLAKQNKELAKTTETAKKTLAAFEDISSHLEGATKKELQQYVNKFLDIKEALTKNSAAAAIVVPKYEELKKKFQEMGISLEKTQIPLTQTGEALKRVGEEAKKLGAFGGIPDLISDTEKLTKLYRDGYIDIGNFSDELNKLQTAFVKSGGSAKIASDTIDKSLGKTLEAISDDAIKVRKDLESLNGGFDFEGLSSSLQQGIGSAIARIISGDSGKDALGDAWVEASGTAAQAVGTYFGGPIGGEIGRALGEAIGEAQVAAITDAFDTDSAGTKARKALDKFFAEALEGSNLSILINDQLTQITDLQFTGNNTKNNIFAGLTDPIKEAFDGVGLAIETTFGYGQELAVELGSVLANNVGGSLNNLQLLLESSGVSFENLGKGIEDAFLKGTISATEAQTALNAIQKTSEKGIPDALGAVVEAFDNLKNAGEKGGRVTVDALKDIAYEAKELNQKTLADTKNFLISSGKFTGEEIDSLFKALADNQITSLEQLQNASTTTLIAVASELEALKFPFKEYADGASNAVEQLTGIPSIIKTNLEINVSTKYQDSGAKQIVESGQLGTRLPAGEGISTSGSQYSRPGSKAIR